MNRLAAMKGAVLLTMVLGCSPLSRTPPSAPAWDGGYAAPPSSPPAQIGPWAIEPGITGSVAYESTFHSSGPGDLWLSDLDDTNHTNLFHRVNGAWTLVERLDSRPLVWVASPQEVWILDKTSLTVWTPTGETNLDLTRA